MADRVGHSPSSRVRLLAASRETLAPHASLEALTAASGRMVSGVSVAAALTSALSLGGAVGVAEVGWGYALPSVLLSALTVALAIWSSIPRRDEIRPGDLDDVDRFFRRQLGCRGRILRASGVTLCLALVAIPVPFIAASRDSPKPSLTITAASSGRRLLVSASAEHAGSHDALIVVLSSGGQERTIGHGVGPSGGTLSVEASISEVVLPEKAVISGALFDGHRKIVGRSIPLGRFGTAPERRKSAVKGVPEPLSAVVGPPTGGAGDERVW